MEGAVHPVRGHRRTVRWQRQLWLPSPAQWSCIRADNMEDADRWAVVGYVLSLGRSAEDLRPLFSMPDSQLIKLAQKWMRHLEASAESLRIAVGWLMNVWADGVEDGAGESAEDSEESYFPTRDWGALVSALMSEYAGSPPEHWMFRMSCAQLMARKDDMRKRMALSDAKMAAALKGRAFAYGLKTTTPYVVNTSALRQTFRLGRALPSGRRASMSDTVRFKIAVDDGDAASKLKQNAERRERRLPNNLNTQRRPSPRQKKDSSF